MDRISVTAHFFDDYGADSLLLAGFCARVRENAGLAPLLMRDVYLHPTIRSLAELSWSTSTPAVATARAEPPRPAGNLQYVLCGLFQPAATSSLHPGHHSRKRPVTGIPARRHE
ncbi:hypothetical protein JOF56_000821 [Kibdelosporangium banguiense]|uniref:Carrier domain-containing protein n=1 Tax=Kibdelosporangium banguiense TaxID=1365924 RepID=A0ABS4T7Z6_9PSEU|nr:hypothetical protein [Kibdelosporangium banguiense]